MIGGLGLPEILIIGVIIVIIFGPSQLPKIGRSMGQTIKEFRGIKKQLSDIEDDAKDTARTIEREMR